VTYCQLSNDTKHFWILNNQFIISSLFDFHIILIKGYNDEVYGHDGLYPGAEVSRP